MIDQGAPLRRRPCTPSDHAHISASPMRFALEVQNQRPWPEAEIVIGEHKPCGSTLAIELDKVRR